MSAIAVPRKGPQPSRQLGIKSWWDVQRARWVQYLLEGLLEASRLIHGPVTRGDRPGIAKRSSTSDLVPFEDRNMGAAFGEKISATHADDAPADDCDMWLSVFGVSYQLSVLSSKLSAVRFQPSAISYQLSTLHCRTTVLSQDRDTKNT